jgi:hypothetical protein
MLQLEQILTVQAVAVVALQEMVTMHQEPQVVLVVLAAVAVVAHQQESAVVLAAQEYFTFSTKEQL